MGVVGMEKERISRLVVEVSDYAKKLRNQFHMNPELSDQGIEQACRYAEEAMQKLNVLKLRLVRY